MSNEKTVAISDNMHWGARLAHVMAGIMIILLFTEKMIPAEVLTIILTVLYWPTMVAALIAGGWMVWAGVRGKW